MLLSIVEENKIAERARPSLRGSASREPALSAAKGTLRFRALFGFSRSCLIREKVKFSPRRVHELRRNFLALAIL